MAGTPRRNEKAAGKKRLERALVARRENHPALKSGELAVVPDTPAVTRLRSGDMRERINDFVEKTGYDPYAELVYMAKMNEHVLPLIEGLKEIIKKGMLNEEDTKFLEELAKFLDECPPDPHMAMKIHQEALKYLAPQLKSSEVKQVVDQTVTINVKKFGE